MDRLTERRPNGVVRSNVMGDSVMLRLAAYEDTGLMPEQVTSKLNALQSDLASWRKRAEAAEKVCSAAHMYVKHINSPPCVGWDMLLDALRKWTDERRGPRDEGKEVSQ